MASSKTTNYDDYIHAPNNHNLKSIPGDLGLPWLGHSMQYLKDPLPFAQQRYKEFGAVSKIQTFGSKGALCLGPEAMQRILLDPGKDFSSKMGFHHRVAKFFGNSFIMEDFEHHKFQRRIAQTAFKNDSLKHYTKEINRIYERAMHEWEPEVGKTIPFFQNIKHLLLEVAAEVFIGEKERGEKVKALSDAFINCTEGIMYVVPFDIPGTQMHRGLQGRQFLEKTIGELVPKRRNSEELDMLSHFCREKMENGEFFPDDEIASQMIFLLFAAHDTTTAALVHTIYYLARNPDIKEKLYQECKALGKDTLDYEDLDKVPYMSQVFNEVQRIRPSVPGIPRRTIRDVEIEGVHIPAHTMIFTVFRFTHWMDEYWKEPFKFDPDRFSPEREEHKQHSFLFHPFGGGAHKCIGMHFSQMEYKCFLHKFLLKYDFEGKHQDPDVYMQTYPLPKPSDDMPIELSLR